jgi:hypothetical protein
MEERESGGYTGFPRGAKLRKADLSAADFEETVFGDTNLRDAQGLDACTTKSWFLCAARRVFKRPWAIWLS